MMKDLCTVSIIIIMQCGFIAVGQKTLSVSYLLSSVSELFVFCFQERLSCTTYFY